MRDLIVHQDARYVRNRELRIEVNHSCNKMHATHYEHCPILNNDDQQVKLSRLKLALLTERTLKQGLES